MPRVRQRARLHEHADDGEPERGLVAEQLRRRAHRAEQRVLRARRPAREHHAVEPDARHREQPQDRRSAGRRAAGTSGARRSRPRRRWARSRTRGTPAAATRYGASRKMRRSAVFGLRLLLEEQLDAVGEASGAARTGPASVGTDPVLHVGDDLAQEPDVEQHRQQQQHEHHDRLADDDQHDGGVDRRRRTAGRRRRAVRSRRVHRVVSTRSSVTAAAMSTSRWGRRRRPGANAQERGAGRGGGVGAAPASVERAARRGDAHVVAVGAHADAARGRSGARRSAPPVASAASDGLAETRRPPS